MSYVSAVYEGDPLVTQYFKARYVDGSLMLYKKPVRSTQHAVRNTHVILCFDKQTSRIAFTCAILTMKRNKSNICIKITILSDVRTFDI